VVAILVARDGASAGPQLVATIGTVVDSHPARTSLTIPVGAPGVSGGDAIVVGFTMDPVAGLVSCGDSQGNAYAIDGDAQFAGVNGVRTVLFVARNVAALAPGDAITVQHPAARGRAMSAFDVARLGALDVARSATGFGRKASTGPFHTTTPDDLLFAVIGSAARPLMQFAPGTGWTALPAARSPARSRTPLIAAFPEDRPATMPGSYTADGRITTLHRWAIVAGAYAPETTTTTTTTSTTTTTITIPPIPCDCGTPDPTRLSFTTGAGQGTCGEVLNSSGVKVLSLACSGLYFGGGLVAVPLPGSIPDLGNSVTRVSQCGGKVMKLDALGVGDTGSDRNCTDAGCLFGAPLPIVNTAAAVLSTCVVNRIVGPAHGFARCDTGDANIDLPLGSDVYLTGDALEKRCVGGPNPGGSCMTDAHCGGGTCVDDSAAIQPCPICNPSTSLCNGGPNNGLPCTPGTSSLNDSYPTSHDCPPPPPLFIGSLSIAFGLTTGTSTKTAHDTPAQRRVICGYCHDGDNGIFIDPAQPCSSDADCTPPFNCVQRSSGAFHEPAASVVEQGSPAGPLATNGSPVPATLVSVFCVPPSFNGTIDPIADLPGPGAVSLPGVVQLLP
jgi:hypothetical protein